ncbi:MAG: Ig-like domain-containing protein [Acidobacteriota bacterium]
MKSFGRFEPVAKKPNWILFNPTYQTAYDPSDPNRPPDNPFGFDGNAVFVVEVPAVGDRANVVTNTSGDPIVKRYLADFATTDDYIQTYTQPEIVETDPLDGSIEVSATADVSLKFSEPMKPSSFRLGDTMIVRNLDTGRDVLGTLRFSSDAKTVSFRPIFGYGPGPYDIFVRVKSEVTNLSGNHIPKEVRIQFRTERDDNVATLIDIRETFDTSDNEDTTFDTIEALAAWNKGATSGNLAGLYATGTSTFKNTTTYLYPPWAWGQNYPGQFQTFWKASEIGNSPRMMTGFSWYYQASNAASTVTAVTINLGHHDPGSSGGNGLSTKLGTNFSDTPVTVVGNLASYSIPQNTTAGSWLAGPTFSKNFKYNGSDNLLFELFCTTDVNGLTNRIINGAWGFAYMSLQRTAYTQPNWWGGGATVTNTYGFDVRFTWLVSTAEAQSLFYDTSVKSPTFLGALIDPAMSEQPAGTTTVLYFQGAPEDTNNPGTADTLAASEWFDNLTKISGYRFVRFNVLMYANTSTSQVPVYDTMTFPYYFF